MRLDPQSDQAGESFCFERRVDFSEVASLGCTDVLPGNAGVLDEAMG